MWASLRYRQCATRTLLQAQHSTSFRCLSTAVAPAKLVEIKLDKGCIRAPENQFKLLSWPGVSSSDVQTFEKPWKALQTGGGLFGPAELLEDEFTLIPKFLEEDKQRYLAHRVVRRLDRILGVGVKLKKKRKVVMKKRQQDFVKDRRAEEARVASVGGAFWPDDCYEWEEGHFDGVIHNYREASLGSFGWTDGDIRVDVILSKLIELSTYVREDLIMHGLQLAHNGYIQGHIDNLEASGDMIMGVSLGASRIMRMTGVEEHEGKSFEVLLNSGDVYINRGIMRHKFKHEVLEKGEFNGVPIEGGQRVSLMFRDKHGSMRETEEIRRQKRELKKNRLRLMSDHVFNTMLNEKPELRDKSLLKQFRK